MKWFYNLKIRNKLVISFIIMAVFSAISGGIGLYSMNNIDSKSTAMYNGNFVPALNLSDTRTALQAVRVLHTQAIYERDPSKLQDKLNQIDGYVKQTNDYLTNYKKTIDNSEEQALFDNMYSNLSEYRNVRDADLELVKNQQYDQAIANISEVNDVITKFNDSMEKLITYENAQSEATLKSNDTNFARLSTTMYIVLALCIILAIFLGIFISNTISRPVNNMVQAADKLALGDVNVEVEVNSKDEIGHLAKAFESMIENIRSQALIVEKIAAGDLTADVTVRSENDLLGRKLSEMIDENNEILSNIASASEQVAAGSKQVSDSSMALSQGATEQASSVEELTASLEEISSQTKLNAENANQANSLAEDAKSSAISGNTQMKEMLNAMEDINEASTSISKIIKVIDDIAFQTNILALNAAVEAARAGQHGKGFAVVAEEVRNLAARSANAAKETTDLIEGSMKKVEGGTRIAKVTADALGNIVGSIEKVAKLVGDIASASNEQASGIAQINQGIIQVSQVVQSNSATSEESAAASEELTSQAVLLKEMVSKYKLKKNFKSYRKLEDISPEVLSMLENMADKNKSYQAGREDISPAKSRIVLNDSEFGKY